MGKQSIPVTLELKRRGYSLIGYALFHNLNYPVLKQVIRGRARSAKVELRLKRDGLWHLIEWKIPIDKTDKEPKE